MWCKLGHWISFLVPAFQCEKLGQLLLQVKVAKHSKAIWQGLMKNHGNIKTLAMQKIHLCLFSHKNWKLHQIARSTSHLQVFPARISSTLPPQQHLVFISLECGSGTVRQDVNADLTRRQHIEGQNWFQDFLQHFWRSLQPKPIPV